MLIRAATLQIFPDERLANLKRRQFETSLQIHTRRGAITDRQGSELAASVPAYSLFADPKLIEDPYGLGNQLGKYLSIPATSLKRRLREKHKRFIWIKRQLTEKQRNEIKSWDVAGLAFVEEPRRVYPNGSLMAQVLGMVGSEGRGLEGLELEYNKDLVGQLKTIILPRDARGRPLLEDGRSLTEVPDGSDLQLTVDHEVQFTLERTLLDTTDHFQADSAVGIVLDAQTSEILALANLPSIDLNEGHRRIKLSDRRNRIVTDAFEPGSTMKTFVIAGALKENLIKPSTRFNCENGHFKVGDKWITEADSDHNFKSLTVTEILAHSSNIGAAKIGFDMGAEQVYRTLADFGFGAKTGVEMPGEARGILNPLPWRPHLLSNVAFGQGIAVTPIQMAAAYAAIANGGILKRPILVKSIHSHEKDQTTEFQAEEVRRVLSVQDAATMRLMLSAATEKNSTGWNARIPGFHVAGKTGTAQMVDLVKGGYKKDAYTSSFAGFVPASNPRYVIYIAVANPKKAYYGSQVAAPVFAKMAQYLVRRAGLPPVLISESNVISSNASEDRHRTALQQQALMDLKGSVTDLSSKSSELPQGFPNLLGLTLREALNKVKDQAGPVNVRGHGVVVRSIPMAGQVFKGKRRVTLVLENP